jgi:hypothetical protein
VFLAADGSVKLGDFNVAKVVQDGANAEVRDSILHEGLSVTSHAI